MVRKRRFLGASDTDPSYVRACLSGGICPPARQRKPPLPDRNFAGDLPGRQVPMVAFLARVDPNGLLAILAAGTDRLQGPQGQILGRVGAFVTGH